MIQITKDRMNKLIIAGAFASVLSLSALSMNMESKGVQKAELTTGIITENKVLTNAEIRSDEFLSLEEHSVALSLAVPKSVYDGKIIVNIDDSEMLNIRMEADAESEIVGKIYGMSYGDLLETSGEWTKISSGEVIGYVKTEYILTGIAAEEKAVSYGKEITTTAITKAAYDEMVAEYIKAQEEKEAAAKAEEARKAEEAKKAAEQAQAIQNVTSSKPQQTEQTTQVDNGQNSTVTYDDEYLLACLIHMEAGSESYEGQLAVGAVVVNRRNQGYGSTIRDVIYAKGQFPGAHNGLLDKRLAQGPNESCLRAAREALSGVNNIGNMLFFHNVRYANYSKYSEYVIIGNHIFFRY